MMGAKTLEAQIADGSAKVEGDVGILKQLASGIVEFRPTLRDHARHGRAEPRWYIADPYEALPRQTIAE